MLCLVARNSVLCGCPSRKNKNPERTALGVQVMHGSTRIFHFWILDFKSKSGIPKRRGAEASQRREYPNCFLSGGLFLLERVFCSLFSA
jgi:hypothetical protein